MYNLRKLNRALKKTRETYDKKRNSLVAKKAPSDEYHILASEEHDEIEDIEKAIEFTISENLRREARSLDVELPAFPASGLWFDDAEREQIWLRPEGRELVRKRIYEEKARQFEIKTLWLTRFWLPLLAALVGIIGAATGLIAVWHHGK